MKKFALLLIALSGLFAGGCALMDPSVLGPDDRVLTGEVRSVAGDVDLPPNSEVTIRVVDLSGADGRGETLAEETIENPGRMPVAFRSVYRGVDAGLMGYVKVEARISVDGRLSYVSTGGHPITMNNVNATHVIQVMPTAQR